MKKILVALIMLTSFNVAASGFDIINDTTVTEVHTYVDYGNGDVLFKVNSATTNCSHGYWFNKNDAGYESNLSSLLSALQAKNKLKIYGYQDKKWAGSTGNYCKVYKIILKQQ